MNKETMLAEIEKLRTTLIEADDYDSMLTPYHTLLGLERRFEDELKVLKKTRKRVA